MYSRYSGFSIPKNYGGSRFQPEREPEVKAHRPSSLSASRVARSPSFVPFEERAQDELSSSLETSVANDSAPLTDEHIEDSGDEAVMSSANEDSSTEIECTAVDDASEECGEVKEISKLKTILSRFDKDALIILGLILLLMSDSDKENDDIVALLALLLLG